MEQLNSARCGTLGFDEGDSVSGLPSVLLCGAVHEVSCVHAMCCGYDETLGHLLDATEAQILLCPTTSNIP